MMPWTRVLTALDKALVITVQILALWLFAWLCQVLASDLHAPLPGSIIGFAILFALLQLKIVRLAWIERGANFLLAQLLLFFVPSAVGVVQYPRLVRAEGLQLYIIIALSTALVMTVTGLIAQRLTSRPAQSGPSPGKREDSV